MTSPVATLGIIDFALRRFDLEGNPNSNKLDTRIRVKPDTFVDYVRSCFKDNSQLKDGYAPFCKHIFVPNVFPVIGGVVELKDDLQQAIQTGYQARTAEELPVLTRWVNKEKILALPSAAPAKYIDVILYSGDQVLREREAMKQECPEEAEVADWYIISLKFQDTDKETPMMPITAMRNALISEGGSGVDIDREAYKESVAFWDKHIEVQ